ncbi:MAG: hypothetical protein LBG62_01305 [Candidatus Methanoplasma sp.]|jgi:hypothetical protein|nr:hypothetical protein [Candidatus Methanoplasma sp.]
MKLTVAFLSIVALSVFLTAAASPAHAPDLGGSPPSEARAEALAAQGDLVSVIVRVTPDGSGGVIVGKGNAAFPAGSYATIEVRASQGYEFLHWEDNPLETSPERTIRVPSDGTASVTYTAVFEQIVMADLVLMVKDGVGGTVRAEYAGNYLIGGGAFEDGASVIIDATPRDGYRFVKWSDGDRNPVRMVPVHAPRTEYVAEFEKIPGAVKSDDGVFDMWVVWAILGVFAATAAVSFVLFKPPEGRPPRKMTLFPKKEKGS